MSCRPHIVLTAVLTAMLLSTQSMAAGLPTTGKIIAVKWCASCHKVTDEQNTTMADVPTFAAIAKEWIENVQPLKSILADPHPIMPNFDLTRNEIDDLLAYIQTQR
jgi:mono/diheme cytochrome c family protein